MPVLEAKRTPTDRPGSGWYEILPPPGPARELRGELIADWVVVGAGFAGLAAARRLSQLRPGERVVLIEAQRVGFGAAGRNSGFMIDLPHHLQSDSYAGGLEADRKEIEMNRSAIAFAREAVADYGLEAHFDPCGKYHGAADARGLKALASFAAHLTRLGEPFERLDAGDLERLTGTDYYESGIYTPGAAMVQPAGYVRGWAAGLAEHVDLYELSPVLRIETGRPHKVHTPKGCISSPKVILTVNGHLDSFGLFRRRLLHIYLHASMTRALTAAEETALGGAPAWGLIPADPMGTTVRRTREGRIVVRNSVTYSPDMTCRDRALARAFGAHDKAFRHRFPMLPEVAMEHRWSGQICLSWNGVPAFGEIEEGVYAAGCQNGLGVCKGMLHGKLIADLAAGGNAPFVADLLALDAPKKLPPEPFASLGANFNIWWLQRRAGKDF